MYHKILNIALLSSGPWLVAFFPGNEMRKYLKFEVVYFRKCSKNIQSHICLNVTLDARNVDENRIVSHFIFQFLSLSLLNTFFYFCLKYLTIHWIWNHPSDPLIPCLNTTGTFVKARHAFLNSTLLQTPVILIIFHITQTLMINSIKINH